MSASSLQDRRGSRRLPEHVVNKRSVPGDSDSSLSHHGLREGGMGKRAGRRDGPAGKGQEALPALGLRLFLGPQLGIAVLICLAGAPALGQENYPPVFDNLRENQDVVIGLSLVVGLVLFSTITALLYLREHRRWTKSEAAFLLELNHLRANLDRAEVFLSAGPQI